MPVIAAARLSNALTQAKTSYIEGRRSRAPESSSPSRDNAAFKDFLVEALTSNVVASTGTNKPLQLPATSHQDEELQYDAQSFACITLRNLIEAAKQQNLAEKNISPSQQTPRPSIESVLHYLIESQSYASSVA